MAQVERGWGILAARSLPRLQPLPSGEDRPGGEERTMTAETVVAEPHAAITRSRPARIRRMLHRELQHYATKADLKETELRVQADIRSRNCGSYTKIQEAPTACRHRARIGQRMAAATARIGLISGLRPTIKDAELKRLEGVRSGGRTSTLRLPSPDHLDEADVAAAPGCGGVVYVDG